MKKTPSASDLERNFSYTVEKHTPLHIIYRKISFHLARPFLSTDITPNQVTGISMVFALAGAMLLSVGEIWAYVSSFVCLVVFTLLDHVDGIIARYKKMTTFTGEVLESFTHPVLNLCVDVGLIIGIYRMTGATLVLVIGSVMVIVRVFTKYISYAKYRAMVIKAVEKPVSVPHSWAQLDHYMFSNMYVNWWIFGSAMIGFILGRRALLLFGFITIQTVGRILKLVIAIQKAM